MRSLLQVGDLFLLSLSWQLTTPLQRITKKKDTKDPYPTFLDVSLLPVLGYYVYLTRRTVRCPRKLKIANLKMTSSNLMQMMICLLPTSELELSFHPVFEAYGFNIITHCLGMYT